MRNPHHLPAPGIDDLCGGRAQAKPIDTLLRGSTIQGRSSLELSWEGLSLKSAPRHRWTKQRAFSTIITPYSGEENH
jgi:hypothetical protein